MPSSEIGGINRWCEPVFVWLLRSHLTKSLRCLGYTCLNEYDYIMILKI
ncbi:MAG TPA: hypothetical protein V6C93_15570 [Allocoleopsis sp.]